MARAVFICFFPLLAALTGGGGGISTAVAQETTTPPVVAESPFPAITQTATAIPELSAAAGATHDGIFAGPPEFAGPLELVPSGNPAAPEFIGPPLVMPFTILDSQVRPGTVARLEWRASQTLVATEGVSPMVVVHGVNPGPVLCLIAGIHGDELNGVEIVRRIVNELDPARLSGTVIGVPIVNLFGFSRNSRYLPDRRDLNRYFPGTRFGSIAARIAYGFFHDVITHCAAMVDFHTGSFDRSNLPQVRADLRIPQVLEFTRGFGATTVLHSPGSRGMLRVAGTAAGIPAVTFEVGAPGHLQTEEIEYGVQAIHTLLYKLGMVADNPGDSEPQSVFYDSTWVRANAAGLLISDVELGDTVEKGTRLGRIVDPIHNTEHEITAPAVGTVLGKALNQVVLPGFATYHLGARPGEAHTVKEAVANSAVVPVVEDEEEPMSEREQDAGADIGEFDPALEGD